MSIPTVSNSLENTNSNLAIHASVGASIWALHTYVTLPGILSAGIYGDLQSKFGYTLGMELAKRAAPAILADMMPKMVAFSLIGGACGGVLFAQVASILYQGGTQLKDNYFSNQSKQFLEQCKRIADIYEKKLVESESDSEEDGDFVFLSVNGDI